MGQKLEGWQKDLTGHILLTPLPDRNLEPTAPDWLPDLAEAIGGMRLAEDEFPVLLPPAERQAILEKLQAIQDSETSYGRWLQRFLSTHAPTSNP